MKLPKHYEKWINEQFPKSSSLVLTGMRAGARRMYVKLMEDFAPAIEALKDCPCTVSERLSGHRSECLSGPALAALKEKGLVE